MSDLNLVELAPKELTITTFCDALDALCRHYDGKVSRAEAIGALQFKAFKIMSIALDEVIAGGGST
jgi:hypothetical protein